MKPDRNPTKFRSSVHLQYFARNMSEFLSYYKKSHAGRQQSSGIFPPEFQPTWRNKNIPRNYAKVSYGRFNHCSGANKCRNGFNCLDEHVSPPPRPDRLYIPLILSSMRNLKSFLGSERPEHKDTY